MGTPVVRNLLISLAATLTACSTIESTLQYREGTQALERGEYPKAISALEEAVKLEPKNSSAHANLAAAYARVGRMNEAWFFTRQALLANPSHPTARINFTQFWTAWEASGLFREGTPSEAIRDVLGRADIEANAKDGSMNQWIYAVKVIEFKNGKLFTTRNIR
ncbi:MAG: tetratricopeptide repeat protein [Burkholderiales bacterium]